jgi:hypothetical protein
MFNFTVHSKSRKIPKHSFKYSKFDVTFVDVMTRLSHFKSLEREMGSDFKPNHSHSIPLYDEIIKYLED